MIFSKLCKNTDKMRNKKIKKQVRKETQGLTFDVCSPNGEKIMFSSLEISQFLTIGKINEEGNLPMFFPVKSIEIGQILIRSILNYFGPQYKVVDIKSKDDGVMFYTNLPYRLLHCYNPNIHIPIWVVKEDLFSLPFSFIVQNKHNLITFCRKRISYEMIPIFETILRSYGENYKIIDIDDFDGEYFVVSTNFPLEVYEKGLTL